VFARTEIIVIRIRLEEAVPGQKVARPVTTPTGTVLLQAGELLTGEAIDSLKRKGVELLVVEGDDPSSSVRPAAERLADLDIRFAGHEHNRLMMELKAMVARQITQEAPRADC
jgi:hypothetical protein